MFHPDGPQKLCDEASEKDVIKIEMEADVMLEPWLSIEQVFIRTIDFAKRHGLDISRSGMYKIECQTSLIIFLADSEEEVVMRVEEAIRS